MNAKLFVLIVSAIVIPSILGLFISLIFADINIGNAQVNDNYIDVKYTPLVSHNVALMSEETETTSTTPPKVKNKLYSVSYDDKELLDTEIAELKKYVCMILTSSGVQGSGVLINDEGYILTNYHVVNRGSIWVDFQDGEDSGTKFLHMKAKLIDFDKNEDIALIHVDNLSLGGYIKFAPENSIKLGEQVVSIGSSQGLINTLSFGHVTALRPYNDGNVIQTDAAISAGNSGGALLNKKGQLIGITTFKITGGENLNFAISNEKLMRFLDKVNYSND
ncbi:S1C family serine protease [Acetivibrio clariflavus]|uniref:Trypsin-like serine protease with C-terminal PDZ domain n=1 Tax=Acetivibrio clariflavus (strain DSM 19732 / NBRC 101661 / EBR45) TaxID=720554 RepID=G8LUW5_ACECE|nr:trypsin-like peptidase domain-containing protein [Acetivibrio clariflavus]AEV68495.1 trypsin-like serine protease with C-terminal PDZ domain [Acetivibrio clariflavus DSM 19732]